LVKFFKKKPEKCSICNQEKMIYKKGRANGIELKYCKECYDGYFKVVEERVKDQVTKAVKSGKMIGMHEATAITKEITAEIEAEQAKKVIENGENATN
jgi:hypothetical protein